MNSELTKIGMCKTCEVELVNTSAYAGRVPLFQVTITYCPTCEDIHYTQTSLVSGDMCPPNIH